MKNKIQANKPKKKLNHHLMILLNQILILLLSLISIQFQKKTYL